MACRPCEPAYTQSASGIGSRVPPRPDGNDSMEGRVPPRPVSRSSSEPPDCLHCRGSERRLRTREAHGVRQLAGAFAERHAARGATHDYHPRPYSLLAHRRTSLDGQVASGLRARKSFLPARDAGGRGCLRPRYGVTAWPVVGRRGAGQPIQRRQAAAVHALPRLRTAPPNSRSAWSAPACWRFSGNRTALGDLPPHSCLPRTTELLAHPTTLLTRGPGSTPA